MPTLQIRDVPEEERAALASAARERGESLQAYLRDLVSEAARRERVRAFVRDAIDRADAEPPIAPGEDVPEMIRDGRERNDARWTS